ncbi:MAG TPA: hypothetical protein VMM76_14315 [Pirellulaceae bacterium]|nr:hypothetical protein [Pirellulaceae bacterium]
MVTTTFLLALAGTLVGEATPTTEVERQNSTYRELWETDFVWKFDDLPLAGGVDSARIPYSGYIYPDKQGGTVVPLRKYDRAFNGGRMLASGHEQWDTTAFKEPVNGFFGKVFKMQETPDWYGHCNGWTSAAIRHAEPVKSVTKNGVTFSPADIKGLLAELYIYNEHIVLAGENEAPIGAAAFHAIIANWIGRGEHPLGIEAEPGGEKWNYPAYAFAASAAKHSPRQVEVTMNVVYAADSRTEWDESPRIEEVKYFHYRLDLDTSGKIVGGNFFRDSATIDMLWVPLRPKAPGTPGNEQGNPYINVETILSLWRESAPSEARAVWLNVDPTEIIDRDRLPIPVVEIIVAESEELEQAELESSSRAGVRRFTTANAPSSPSGNCYGLDQQRKLHSFQELLLGGTVETATHRTDAALVR